jgi:hypothetical protein
LAVRVEQSTGALGVVAVVAGVDFIDVGLAVAEDVVRELEESNIFLVGTGVEVGLGVNEGLTLECTDS